MENYIGTPSISEYTMNILIVYTISSSNKSILGISFYIERTTCRGRTHS